MEFYRHPRGRYILRENKQNKCQDYDLQLADDDSAQSSKSPLRASFRASAMEEACWDGRLVLLSGTV